MKLYTTLNQIRSHSPCSDGWETLLQHLGKTEQDDEPLSFATILESNGFDDTLWCLQTVAGYDREIRLYAVWCARKVEHLDPSGVAKQINDISLRYANGEATEDELEIAWEAARASWETAMAAAWAAREAGAAVEAWEAAMAAREAAMAAAGEEAWVAQKQEFIKRFCTEE